MEMIHVKTPLKNPFNGGFTRVGDRLLVVARSDESKLASFFVNDRYEILEDSVRHLGLNNNIDPRPFVYLGQAFMSTSYYWMEKGGYRDRIELWPLLVLGNEVIPVHSQRIAFDHIEGVGSVGAREKNWVPWVLGDDLLYTYGVQPHRVLRVDLKRRSVKLASQSAWRYRHWEERWGDHFRGSTPPVRLDSGEYLTTFHTTRLGDKGCLYYTGFMTFEPTPPFKVTRISQSPVIGPEHASVGSFRRNQHMMCVFCQSLDLVGDRLRVMGGDNDVEVAVIHLSLADVLSRMVPVDDW
jgi:predicted GH43/DUF377 family glycosyl hydrolase